jgi:hypothetical protein
MQQGFFTQKKPADAPLDCSQTIACYDQCIPRVEECLLRCDGRSSYYPVQRARAVANCAAEYSCSDESCERERCGPVYQACVDPLAPAPPPAPTVPPPQ